MKVLPKQLTIETTNVCNLNCNWCPRANDSMILGHINENFFYEIIDKIDCEVVVTTWINGEPTLHPKFHEFARHMNEKNLKYCLTTNGRLWKEESFQAITDENSGCYQIMFSIDGFYNKSNDIIRKGSDLDVVKESLDRFLKLKKDKKSSIDVGVKIVNKGQDYEEIEDFLFYWLSSGKVDYVSYAGLMGPDGSPNLRHYPCKSLNEGGALGIRLDGSIIRCCYNEDAINKKETYLGNIKDYKTISEAFNSKAFNTIRKGEMDKKFSYPCDTCSISYNGKGFYGIVTFRDEEKRKVIPKVYWHNDAFQEFYSLKDTRGADRIFTSNPSTLK